MCEQGSLRLEWLEPERMVLWKVSTEVDSHLLWLLRRRLYRLSSGGRRRESSSAVKACKQTVNRAQEAVMIGLSA